MRILTPSAPLRNLADVELTTADYVSRYNQQRLMQPPRTHLTRRTQKPKYYDQLDASQPAASQNPEGAWNSGWFTLANVELVRAAASGARHSSDQ